MGVSRTRIDRISVHRGHILHPSGIPTNGPQRLFFGPGTGRVDSLAISLVLALFF